MSIRLGIGAAGLTLTAWVRPALARKGQPPEPHDLWTAWGTEPAILVSLLHAAWACSSGIHALWRRAGRGRGVRTYRVAAFAGVILFGRWVSAEGRASPRGGQERAAWRPHPGSPAGPR